MSTLPQPGLTLVDWHIDETGERHTVRAQSSAGKVLGRQIERYLTAEVCGRSCLIAGSRGSGKTTLIQMAYDSVRDRVPGMRPIVVRLHGPSLLKPFIPKRCDPTTPAATEAERISENVLRSVTINLYQTTAEEFATAYRKVVKSSQLSPAFRGEAFERAAQLRLTLDGAPGAAVLRDFWESVNALQRGVLFNDPSKPDRGLREIAALATAAEAYRSCTGEFKRENVDKTTSGRQEELKVEAAAKGKELSQALVGVISGIAVGGGVAAGGGSLTASAVTGAITAVLTLGALNYTANFTREETAKEEITFLPDLSSNALVHRLPQLLRRLRQAGIVPIFFVDELDKSPARSLDDLVANLKFLCADQAFFCFLTDRAYLSEVARQNREANTTLLTVFTDTFFVLYDTSSFREYLRQIIRCQTAPDDIVRELQFDIEALQLVLIHRSHMLAFNLAREVADVVVPNDPDKRLRLQLGEPRTNPIYQMFLVLQLAVEVVLRDRLVAQRIEQDPDFGQILYDALYYPTRRWYQGKQELDCTLNALMEGIAEMYAPKLVRDGRTARREAAAFLDQLEEDDREFLNSQVRTLLALVCDPGLLRKHVIANQIVSTVVCDVVTDAPKLLIKLQDDHYKWKYNRYGIPFDTAETNVVVEETRKAGQALDSVAIEMSRIPVVSSLEDVRDGLEPAIDIINAFDQNLRDLARSLTDLEGTRHA